MTEVETAVALARAASRGGDLLKAESRLWASQVALSVPTRILAVLTASSRLGDEDLDRLRKLGDVEGALSLQAGRLADMDLVAERLTGLRVTE
jgi:hypothetical protein